MGEVVEVVEVGSLLAWRWAGRAWRCQRGCKPGWPPMFWVAGAGCSLCAAVAGAEARLQ